MNVLTATPAETISFDSGRAIFKDQGFSPITKISVLTKNTGPFEDDVAMAAMALFFGDTVLVVPSEHPGYQHLFDALTKELALDFEAYIKAQTSTDNAEFVIWIDPAAPTLPAPTPAQAVSATKNNRLVSFLRRLLP